MSLSSRSNPKCCHFGCDKRLSDMGLLHVKLPLWQAKQEGGTSTHRQEFKTRSGEYVHLKGDGRKKWLKQWLEYSGHSGCDDDHALMKQRRRPNRACLSHHLATQYYGEEDGDDAE